MSATAVHFSMIAMRAARLGRRMISVATSRDTFFPTQKKKFVKQNWPYIIKGLFKS